MSSNSSSSSNNASVNNFKSPNKHLEREFRVELLKDGQAVFKIEENEEGDLMQDVVLTMTNNFSIPMWMMYSDFYFEGCESQGQHSMEPEILPGETRKKMMRFVLCTPDGPLERDEEEEQQNFVELEGLLAEDKNINFNFKAFVWTQDPSSPEHYFDPEFTQLVNGVLTIPAGSPKNFIIHHLTE